MATPTDDIEVIENEDFSFTGKHVTWLEAAVTDFSCQHQMSKNLEKNKIDDKAMGNVAQPEMEKSQESTAVNVEVQEKESKESVRVDVSQESDVKQVHTSSSDTLDGQQGDSTESVQQNMASAESGSKESRESNSDKNKQTSLSEEQQKQIKTVEDLQESKVQHILTAKNIKDEKTLTTTSEISKSIDVSFSEVSQAIMEMKSPVCSWETCIHIVWKYSRTCATDELNEFVQFLIDQDVLELFQKFLKDIEVESPLKFLDFPEKFESNWMLLKKYLICVWILSDKSVEFCRYILHSDFLKFILAELEKISCQNFTQHDWLVFFLKSLLGILHNSSRHVTDGKWTLREAGLVDKLQLFLSCEIPMVRVKSLITLSYIISDTENEMINSDDDNIEFILSVLRDALKSSDHMSKKFGMTAQEILKGLNNLSINDENKLRIVQNGALEIYDELLQSGNIEEKKLTITSLWSLAFHHYNKRKMKQIPGIMKALYDLQRCEDEGVCHAARGTYWELENVSKPSIGHAASSSSSHSVDDPNIPHIMISYQWDCQPIMIKVKDRLRHAGYKVWMDVEHMTGSTLEAMALAVEKAAVVLICMSQKYKDSPNCRTEAEYVFRLRKDFIPLRLQRQYVPDGWLGIMVGTRLYFDIYGQDKINLQMPLLIRELRGRGKLSPSHDTPDKVILHPVRAISREAAPMVAHGDSDVMSWRCQDVSDWLTSVDIQEVQEKLKEIDGVLLLEMKKIQKTAPEYFFSMLKSDFSMTAVELLKFSRALRSLR